MGREKNLCLTLLYLYGRLYCSIVGLVLCSKRKKPKRNATLTLLVSFVLVGVPAPKSDDPDNQDYSPVDQSEAISNSENLPEQFLVQQTEAAPTISMTQTTPSCCQQRAKRSSMIKYTERDAPVSSESNRLPVLPPALQTISPRRSGKKCGR